MTRDLRSDPSNPDNFWICHCWQQSKSSLPGVAAESGGGGDVLVLSKAHMEGADKVNL